MSATTQGYWLPVVNITSRNPKNTVAIKKPLNRPGMVFHAIRPGGYFDGHKVTASHCGQWVRVEAPWRRSQEFEFFRMRDAERIARPCERCYREYPS